WISELAKQSDSRSSFNELMDTPVDFSNFLINRLKVDTLTSELLAGPTYELLKGSCKSLVELEYHLEEVYKATTDQLDWVNPEDLVPRTMWIQEPIGYDKHALWGVSYRGRKRPHFYGFAVNRKSTHDVYSKRRIIAVTELKIIEWHNYKQLDWITVRVEDLQLGVEIYQKKLNLTNPDTYHPDLKRKEAYIAYSNPKGFIYQNKDKKNRLIWIDELHKFSDGTLIDVRTALDDQAKDLEDHEELGKVRWRKAIRGRLQDATKDHMISHMFSLSFKRTMWIQEPIGYDKHALWGVSYRGRKRPHFYGFAVNRKSTHDVYSKRRIIAVTELKIIEWHNYKQLDWITV
nr:hypothetical protein [Tanacetum cinerariifolium]